MEWLKQYREKIDQVDSAIINLLAERFEIVKEIWEYKKEHWIPARQEWRFQEMMEERKRLARELWLSEDFIEVMWNTIHEYALTLEE